VTVIFAIVKRLLRKIFGPKREEVEYGENCIMRSSIICTFIGRMYYIIFALFLFLLYH
jgi:hypothetical protein